jgi:hypothetical protein
MNNVTSIRNRGKLGTLGEDLFCLLEKCTKSSDPFDCEKDAIDANGKTVEIKTQARYSYKNMFTIRAKKTNLNKCMKVDRLIFIEFDQSDTIGVFECIDRSKFVQYTTSKGIEMVGWSINDNMSQLYSIKDKKLAAYMRSL